MRKIITTIIAIVWAVMLQAQTTTSYEYDSFGRLVRATTGTTVQQYTYDALGNRLTYNVSTNTSPLPDLVVVNHEATPTEVVPGADDALSLSCRVLNQGASPAWATSQVGYYLSEDTSFDASDIFLSSNGFGGLGVNNYHDCTESITIPLGTPAGTYYILFFVDDAFEVTESNENNNVVYKQIIVLGATVELSITDQTVNPSMVAPGENIQLFCNIVNNGNTHVMPETGKLGYFLSTNATHDASDIFLRSDDFFYIPAGGSGDYGNGITIPANTPAGTYYILFYADYENSIDETDENNNVGSVEITVGNLILRSNKHVGIRLKNK